MRKLLLAALIPLSGLQAPEPEFRAFDPRNDDAAILAPGQPIERNLERIAEVGRIMLPEVPWSDRAWEHNRGLLNERYTDPAFSGLPGWPERRVYLERKSPEVLLDLPSGPERDRAIARLSPAEKYDLVMGTLSGGLAEAIRHSLDHDMDAAGRFPGWWGICEGSAAAAVKVPEPVATVTVRSIPYGVDVPFYAPDIKALVSMLWSSYNAMMQLPEIGQQCDGAGGGSCFNVNPASFHKAIHHFLGRGNGHLITDLDETRAVWNHPLVGYDVRYFRPGRNADRTETGFRAALAPAGGAGDPRRELRAPGTAYVLGVITRIFYGKNLRDHPLEGSVRREVGSQLLRYELELDENLNLLGGEWLSKKRADILWTIPAGKRPESPGDMMLGSMRWDGLSTPANWQGAARISAARNLPLRKVVEELLRRSVSERP
jgi:hypothetical protein